MERKIFRNPVMIAAGPGTADVGLNTVKYLKNKLKAKFLEEIEPADFFNPPYQLSIEEGVIKLAEVRLKPKPRNRFYYRPGPPRDLIFFIGNDQPLEGKGFEFALKVIYRAKDFGVKRLYIPGAFLTDIHHQEEPQIFGQVTEEKLIRELLIHDIEIAPPIEIGYNFITWLLMAAKKKNLETICLISEIPRYNRNGPNFKARRALIEVLSQMLEIKFNLKELNQLVMDEERELDQMIEELKRSPAKEPGDFFEFLEEISRESFLQYLEVLEKGEEELKREIGRTLLESTQIYAQPKEVQPPIKAKDLNEYFLRYIEGLIREKRGDKFREEINKLSESLRLTLFKELEAKGLEGQALSLLTKRD